MSDHEDEAESDSNDGEVEERSVVSLALELASSCLDAAPSQKRAHIKQEALSLVQSNDPSSRHELASSGQTVVTTCKSLHGRRRLLSLFTSALGAGNNSSETVLELCRGTCQLLQTTNHAERLLNQCVKSLKQQHDASSSIKEALLILAKEEESSVVSYYTYASALSLWSCLLPANNAEPEDVAVGEELLRTVVLPRVLTGKHLASGEEIELARSFFSLVVSQSHFDEILGPALGLKLRANPEASLATVGSILACLDPTKVCVDSHLEKGDETSLLLPSVMKPLRSPKAEYRDMASSIIVTLAQLSSLEGSNSGGVERIVVSLSQAIQGGKASASSVALTTPELRIGAYRALGEIATQIMSKTKEQTTLSQAYSATLDALTTALAKEPTAETTAKELGYEALLHWMALAKQQMDTMKKGYECGLAYLAQPLVDASRTNSGTKKSSALSAGTGSEVRFRLGSLLLLTTVVDSPYSFDWVESVWLDVARYSKQIEADLQATVEAAIKKHAASDLVPQVDGLLALFFELLLNAETGGQHSLSASSQKALSAGSLTIRSKKGSFVYSSAMTDASATDPLIGMVLPRLVALYCKHQSQKEEPCMVQLKSGEPSAAAWAMACCVCNPHPPLLPLKQKTSCDAVSSLQTILTYAPVNAGPALLESLFRRVNQLSQTCMDSTMAQSDTRESREASAIEESYTKLPLGKLSVNSSHKGYDPNTVRRVANHLLQKSSFSGTSLAKALVLTHAGTTQRNVTRQRAALVSNTSGLIQTVVLPLVSENDSLFQELAAGIALYASSIDEPDTSSESDGETPTLIEETSQPPSSKSKKENKDDSEQDSSNISPIIHEAAISLLTTLGGMAGNADPEYDDPEDEQIQPFIFARRVCVEELPILMANKLTTVMSLVEAITTSDTDLYKSANGILYQDDSEPTSSNGPNATISSNAEKKRPVKTRKNKGDFGSGFEDEEWEREMKKELAEKKRKEEAAATPSQKQAAVASLTPEQKELLATQTKERARLTTILDGAYPRVLMAIKSLALSDIEVGNSSLPSLSTSVISCAISKCDAFACVPGLKSLSMETLTALASCVYEIDEMHAPTIARALTICFSPEDEKSESSTSISTLTVSALPSPCAPAACAIFEMEEYGECLSGPSFAFMFPILRAALKGPRTTPGCEGALEILHRHTTMIAGDEADPVVSKMRKEMASTVLELLCHDRSQTFMDPTPYDAIVSCYTTNNDKLPSSGPVLSSSEVAPLIGEIGALGGKNCRVGSMIALGSIASNHPKLVKNNPLVENRVWVNCFDKNESVKSSARNTWFIANGISSVGDEVPKDLPPPSKMYAIALLPLLNHSDKEIAESAANAFASAMGMYLDTVERNILKLCNTFIDSYPTSFDEDTAVPKIAPPVASTISGPKKKKTSTINTGLPKKTTKKKTLPGGNLGKITGTTTKKVVKKIPKKAPSNERTFDRELLESQFLSPSSKKEKDIETDSPIRVNTRLGILRVISAITESSASVELELPVLKMLIGFLSSYGLADKNDQTRSASVNSTRDIIAVNGASDDAIAFLLPHLEAVLSTGKADESCLGSLPTEKVPHDIGASDRRKEGAVVALGSVALHLKGEDNFDKIDNTIDMLISALGTPSEGVQSSVALCLSKLMKKGRTQERVEAILQELLRNCLHGETLASRRGAAYGISAVVKGSGIASLKKFEVVKQLEESTTSGSSVSKEGALFAIELLSGRLGLLFEPYVIVLLPALLKAFSDNSDHVRSAAANTAGLIMSKLSAHGVKLVMPAVLAAFNEPAWRTKEASIHMLGSMSHLAPKQLASCLPKVVPKLTEAFSDTHPKVKASAEEALDEISQVIRNPEVSSISSVLLKALTDPANQTTRALEALIETEFLHAIDAPSLALIVPVLHRGLRDRAATTKRYGALIAGNICTMINDPKDFVPYLPMLLPDLKSVLLDPIPDVRSTAAKALGALTRGLGEDALPGLRQWLISTLRDDAGGSVERSGAAQGLTEVLCAGGATLVESVMRDEILPLRSHPNASTREGVLWVLTFLPSALGQAFTPLIEVSLPALLSGLSDNDSDNVREVAMRAGRVLIRSHGKAHVDKILPSIEDGLSDDDYRIRVASLHLLGDLLSMLGGTTVVKGDADTQDDARRAERAQAQIALVLGSEKRKRVLSRIYLARNDTAAVVRLSAVQVWKTVVSVTPRTLREILSVLVSQIVTALASGHPERTQAAGRCLGDIVNKLGDIVLPEIIPVLRNALYSDEEHTRMGACVGLSEVIACSSKDQISKYLEVLVKVVQDALCDEEESVRKMGASCFQSLHSVVGSRALDEVVPVLLATMERGDQDEVAKARALNGLTGILSIRSRELLPYLIPRLLRKPITSNHADALGSIASVTGSSIHMHFGQIIPSLLSELSMCSEQKSEEDENVKREGAIRDCCRSIFRSVEPVGLNWLISEIAGKCVAADNIGLRKESCWMFGAFVDERKLLYSFIRPSVFRLL
eukprot:scaffold36531_cov52-Attheya_sp.AAC.4